MKLSHKIAVSAVSLAMAATPMSAMAPALVMDMQINQLADASKLI